MRNCSVIEGFVCQARQARADLDDLSLLLFLVIERHGVLVNPPDTAS